MVYVIIHVGVFFVILSYALSSHGTLLQYGLAAPVSCYSLLQTLHRLNGSKLLCLCIFSYSVCVWKCYWAMALPTVNMQRQHRN